MARRKTDGWMEAALTAKDRRGLAGRRARKDDLPEGCVWKGRGRERKVVCTGEHAGLGYTPRENPCGVSYEQFRSPWEFGDAFEMVGGRGGAQYAPSKKKVLRMLGKLKRDEYERHLASCAGAGAAEREESAYDWNAPEDWSGLAAIPSGRALPVALGRHAPPSGFLEESVFKTPLYHGSDNEVQRFDPARGREFGIYLTPRPRYARRYGARLHEVLVDVRRPLIVENKGEIVPRDLTREDIERLAQQGYDALVTSATGRLEDADEVVLFRADQAHVVDVRGLGKSLPLVETEDALERVAARQPQARLDKLPKHIEPFGRYMQLAAAEPITPRRLVKAYVITRSSVQRPSRPKETVCRAYPDYRPLPRHADVPDVRAEDAMARLLFSPAGEAYLNAAAQGRFDAAAAREIGDRLQCFGLIDNEEGLFNDMRYAAETLSARTDAFAAALSAPAAEYWKFLRKNVKGVAESKAGFIAALLGRGDIPTFDARERDLWLRYIKQRKKKVSWSTIERLRDRFKRFPMELPEGLEPFKVHLVHHALWEAYEPRRRPKKPKKGQRPRWVRSGPSKTSHGALIRSMQFAGLGAGRRTFQQMLAEDEGAYPRLGVDADPVDVVEQQRRKHRAEREHYAAAGPDERRLLDLTRSWETDEEREARQARYRERDS